VCIYIYTHTHIYIYIYIILVWSIGLFERHIWIHISERFIFVYYSNFSCVFSKPCSAQWRESVTNFFFWIKFCLDVALCCWSVRFICFFICCSKRAMNLCQSSQFVSWFGIECPNMSQKSNLLLFCMVHIQYFIHANCVSGKFSQHKKDIQQCYKFVIFIIPRAIKGVVLCSLV